MILEKTEKLMRDGLLTGRFSSYAVLVSKGDSTAYITSPDADIDTCFDIASMGKVLVTAPMIFKAVGDGNLSLDDTLEKFFNIPDNDPERDEKRNITIRQMLTHTSGIIRIPLSPEIAEKGNDALAAQIIAHPLAFRPGTGYVYSCNACILLGFIAEKLYGEPLDKLYERYIKAPLGLTRSRFNIPVGEPNSAICYRRAESGGTMVDDENVRVMKGVAGNGANFWTLRDIDTFCRAVLDNRWIWTPGLCALAERDYTPDKSCEEGRGLGWLYVDERYHQTGKLFQTGSFGHCGHTGTSMFMNREERLHVIILTNATRHSAMKFDFRGEDYASVMAMRAEIHNAIADDLA